MSALLEKVEDTYYKFVPHEGAKTLALIFSSVGMQPGKFVFYKQTIDLPVHKLYLNDKNTWYQDGIEGLGVTVEETVQEINELKKRLGADNIITIGSSMGAYAAIMYGALLNCKVLSFGARVVLGTRGSQSFRLAKSGYQFKYKSIVPLVEKSECSILSYQGETDYNDLLAVQQLSHLPNVQCISMKGIAHKTPLYLSKKYGFKRILSDFIDGTPFVEMPEKSTMSNGVRDKVLAALDLIEVKNFVDAKELVSRAADLEPDNDIVHHVLGITLYHLKEHKEAYIHQKRATELSPHNEKAHHHLGICLRAIGRYKESYEANKIAYELDPKLASAYHHAGLALEKLGEHDDAEKEFRQAYSLAKHKKNYRDKFAEVLKYNSEKRIEEVKELLEV
ncbi:tetratricopeptide repeat protein [Bacillus sp. SB49]|uniref:tetratricopeptide repeat protein n=1 Tax=Bacillus sp. SB49 TaxID=1071080 RepID=UPI00040FACC5|nr:tetratricopeptide repeat protein [Bacillus sp. SB49]QHT48034.1 tetratricopeptide repeat protein [Bacillus sp. SB49]